MRDPLGATELADVVVDVAEAEVYDDAVPGTDVRSGGVDEVGVKHQDRSSSPFGCNDAVLVGKPCDSILVE